MGNSSNKSASLNASSALKKDNKRIPPGKRKEKVKKRGFFRRTKPDSGVAKKKRKKKKNKEVIPDLRKYETSLPDVVERDVQDPDDIALSRIRKSLRTDLETFVLNNVLMSFQFFDNYERDASVLRKNPVSEVEKERNARMAKYQRHCLAPDKLHELVNKRVRFRPHYGSRKHCTEYIHSPRLMIIQDNVELYEDTESADYSSVAVGPTYRLTVEPAEGAGYVKLRSDEKRRETYDTILETRRSDDEARYARIDTPTPRGSDENSNNRLEEDEGLEEMPQLTEGQKMMLDLQEHLEEKSLMSKSLTNISSSQGGSSDIYGNSQLELLKRKFGPQNSFSERNKLNSDETPTERRLSGIIRSTKPLPKFNPPSAPSKFNRQNKLDNAKSMPNLNELDCPRTNNKGSPQSDSSGYKSGSDSSGYKSRTNLSLPNSRGSEVDYGYATIKSYSTPIPLEQRRLGNLLGNTSTIPNQCFRSIDVALINKDEEKIRSDNGTYIPAQKLFETRFYLKSNSFIGSFADVFLDGLAELLDIPSETMDSATMQGAQIFCNTHEPGPNKVQLKVHNVIIPTLVLTSWPKAAFEWSLRQRKCVTDKVNHVAYTWPTNRMVAKVKSFGCHMLPVGFMPTRGENGDYDLEWRLAFPEAERYLESCLSHAQARCFMFTLALYKNFMEPIDADIGLTTANIRTLLLWQCEKNYVAWPEDRPGETLVKFLNVLYEALMKEHLPDYFVKGRNQFAGIPRSHIRRVQEKLCRVRENLIMHVLMMVRNLRYVDEETFYPRLDYKKLYAILTTENVIALMNPRLARSVSQQKIEESDPEEDSDEESATDMWAEIRKNDPGRQWNKKVNRQIEAEKAALKLTNEFKKKSVDSIDLLLIPGKTPDSLRRQLILEMLIPHFMDMAKRSNEFRAPKQAQLYVKHAERLAKLLAEEPGNNGSARKLLFQIRNLRDGGMVGIDELRSPLRVQLLTSKPPSFRQPDSPTALLSMDLPPIPSSSRAPPTLTTKPKPEVILTTIPSSSRALLTLTTKPKPEVILTPVKRPAAYKRQDFIIPDTDKQSAALVQALHGSTPSASVKTSNSLINRTVIFDNSASEDESTDF